MALGEYTSVRTQTEQVEAEVAKERGELERNPELETEELAQMWISRGLPADLAHHVAKVVHTNPEAALRVHAQEELGDIVYVELPEVGEKIVKDDPFGAVESVKAVSDVYAPVSGTVLEINDILPDNPETINDDPYGDGWMVRVELTDKDDLKDLMDAEEYAEYVAQQKDDDDEDDESDEDEDDEEDDEDEKK